MKVLSWDDFRLSYLAPRPMAATVGVFDGLHIGHRYLIEKMLAHGKGRVTAAFTFRQNPKSVLRRGEFSGSLMSLDARLELFASLGLDIVVLIDFSANFSKLAGRDFLSILKERGDLAYIAVGTDFSCGNGCDVDSGALKSFLEGKGVEVELVSPVMIDGQAVSSTRIRRALIAGDFDAAEAMLGRPYQFDIGGLRSETSQEGEYRFERPAGLVLPERGVFGALIDDSGRRALLKLSPESLAIVPTDGQALGQASFIQLTKD